MRQGRYSLPPLATLVFFDAVMKHGGFSAAAPGLMVSQAAVSKRIRQLEDWLGAPLFDRGARHAAPTDTAHRLEEPVRLALDYLTASLEAVRVTDTAPDTNMVRLAANGAVSIFWLYPRLQAFATSAAACNVSVLSADDPAALVTDTLDIAIFYGTAPPPGWAGTTLFDEAIAPAASVSATDTDALPLLEYPRLAPDWINWEIWLDRKPGSAFASRRKTSCRSYGHAIGRALAGEGIALASRPLLDDLFLTGKLVPVGDMTLTTTRRYWLIHPQASPPASNVAFLYQALSGDAVAADR